MIFLFYLPEGSENMERVTDTPNTIEVFENDIAFYMQQFMEENQIDNLREISQNVWNGMLLYIQRHVFKGTNKLKMTQKIDDSACIPSTCNAYDIDKVNDLCDYYIYICALYDKVVSIMGFAKFSGINSDTIHDWGNNINKISTRGCDVYKKLTAEREESIVARLSTGKQNPVGLLGMLNHYDNWNMPGVSREQSNKQALTAADLPRLGKQDQVVEVVEVDSKT